MNRKDNFLTMNLFPAKCSDSTKPVNVKLKANVQPDSITQL